MSRKLDDLSGRFRPLAMALLARLTEHGIQVMIVDTLRTPAEHQQNLANGSSWVKHSKHLDGDAMDICPYDIYSLHGADKLQWDATQPVWTKIGLIGESVGLKWGGRWTKRDMGHFEYPT